MSAGHDLRRVDEPVPEWEALLDVIVQAVLLVRTGEIGWDGGRALRIVDCDQYARLAAPIEAAGIDSRRTP